MLNFNHIMLYFIDWTILNSCKAAPNIIISAIIITRNDEKFILVTTNHYLSLVVQLRYLFWEG